jgi:hypothetical protein
MSLRQKPLLAMPPFGGNLGLQRNKLEPSVWVIDGQDP